MSDHFSGPRALAGPPGDIADFYAFPSPERPGHLVLVMNVLPNAGPDAGFADAIVCRFRLRPVTIAATGPAAAFAVGPEVTEFVIDCAFEAPSAQVAHAWPSQRGRCVVATGGAVEFPVHDPRGGRVDGLRVFAGRRADPFFIDFRALQATLATGRPTFNPVGQNSLAGFNVLSVVVEFDGAMLQAASGGPLFAAVAETVVAGKLPVRLERVGRPEVKNVILSMKEHDTVNRDLEIRDLYNLEDPFHMSKEYRGAYRARFNANLAYFDRLDDKTDWPLDAQGAHPLTELLLADHLIVDLSKPFHEASFFEIERAMLKGHDHASCGGRSLNDNIMTTLYTLLINGGNGPTISDGVNQATTPASRTFPYLAPPNPPRTNNQQGGVSR